jgi:hypothetical protein
MIIAQPTSAIATAKLTVYRGAYALLKICGPKAPPICPYEFTNPMEKAEPVARDVVCTRQGHIIGYQADAKEDAMIVAAYTPPVDGNV